MKMIPLYSWYSLFVAAGLVGIQPLAAQTQNTATAGTSALSPSAQVAAAQANYDVWDKPSQPIGPNHRTTVRTTKTGSRRIVEIGTGMNYWNGLQWVPSNPTFVPVADGFIANRLQAPVQLAGDLYTTNAVTIRTPEGIILGSSPVAVALYDSASGNFAVIATITNCAATLVESNQVLYPDAFNGNVCASVVYTISQGTFHQDVVFTGPLDPADYGFPRDTTRIQIITEFYGVPEPDELDRPLYVEANAKVRARMASPDLIDEQLGFGRFVMTTGRAYVTPSQNNPKGLEALVAKEYKTVGDGTYLFESIPYNSIAAALSNLPPCHPSFGSVKVKSTKGYANIPHPGNKPHAGPLMAQASHAPVHGVVVDYVANIHDTMSGVTIFQGDTTYLVSSAVFCNGPTTIEGGAVFKYKPGVSITLNSTLTCKTGQYRPAIFTAVDDDTMGDSMTNVLNSGYTGHISSSGYANPALYAPGAMNFTGLKIRYAQEAIQVYGFSGFSWSVSHAQFVNCIKGIEIQGGGCGCGCSPNNNFNVNNCLFSRVSQPILGTSLGGTVTLYALLANATVDHASALGTLTSCGVNLYIQSTNSIYASVSSSGGVTTSGTKNAFYSDGFNFGSSQISLSSSPFLSFGAGNYYLSNVSNIQTSGITNSLPATLLFDLAKRTTYPPSVIAGTILSTNLVLVPQAWRDTYVTSLGYHYDPIDYAFGNVYVSNASVTASNGVAIATFGTNNSAYGLGFGSGSSFSSIGAPNVPDWIVLFNTVQEGTNLNWQRLTNSVTGELFGATPAPSIYTRFTSWSVLAQDAAQFYAPTNTGPIGFQDSEFHGGTLLSYRPTINLTNCLLERVYSSLVTSDGNSPYIRNSLFYGGIFNYAPNVTNSFVKDNLFDQTVISNNSSVYTTYNGGYNAFVTNNSRLLPAHANDLIVMTNAPHYQAGPLGLYYQTNTSVLINAGHTTADQVGLYQYTVCTNLVNGLQVKETNSVVDIGYHYVATDAYGNPIDTDDSGIPDYLQDTNGVGLFNSDGSGLPDWWEIQNFGTNGVDPYGDPTGDGYDNFYKAQYGMNPHVFYTPAVPHGLVVSFNQANQTAAISWAPSAGAVTSYTVEKSYQAHSWDSPQLSDYTVYSGTTYPDNISGNSPDTYHGNVYDVSYRIKANYQNGSSSAWSLSVPLQQTTVSASIIPGQNGMPALAISGMPANASTVRLVFIDQSAVYWYNDTSFDYTENISVTSFSNNICQLPGSWTPPAVDAYGDAQYAVFVESVDSTGNSSAPNYVWQDFYWQNRWNGTPFYDGRVQLKQNLIFQLRAAGAYSSFRYSAQNPDASWTWITTPTSYAYASFYDFDLSQPSASPPAIDPSRPFLDNNNYRNFVFAPGDVNTSGFLTTGADGDIWASLSYPPTYQFQIGLNNFSSLLATNNTRWLLYDSSGVNIPDGYTDDGVDKTGIITFDTNPSYAYTNSISMSANMQNCFGLPYLSFLLATANAAGTALVTNILYAGSTLVVSYDFEIDFLFQPPINFYWENAYPETAQPKFQTVEYDFWNPNIKNPPSYEYWEYPLPGDPAFSYANMSQQLFITGVGSQVPIAGYAKLAVTNSVYTGVFGYLGQYFDRAYTMTNGIATGTNTGVLFPYGSFFTTQPGPTALVTMPDPDTGARGTCVVYSVSMQLDANHDGNMDLSLNGLDTTSQANPMVAWVNNGHIQPGVNGNPDLDLQAPPASPNSTAGQITCQRDLENFFRLWICGVPALPANQGYTVSISFQNTVSNPKVNLYWSCETNGGTGYLTDTNVAANQVNGLFSQNGSQHYANSVGTVSSGSSYTFPDGIFGSGTNRYLLFEGAGLGEGQLTLTISQNGNIIVQTGVWLDLYDIKDLYEQAHIANISTTFPEMINNSTASTFVSDQQLPSSLTESNQLVVFIHGWRMGIWDYQDFSDTMFKRLYWQGYHGRFASLRWPTLSSDDYWLFSTRLSYTTYNRSEYIGHRSADGTSAYFDWLKARFPGYSINAVAHSMGNIVMMETLKLQLAAGSYDIDNYVMLQAAVPAHCYDTSLANYSLFTAVEANSHTPDIYRGFPGNIATSVNGKIVNFFNTNDFALATGVYVNFIHNVGISWENNEVNFKPDGPWYYSSDGTSCFEDLSTHRTVTDPREQMAFVARPRSKAAGALGGVGGVVNTTGQVDLFATYGFGGASQDHSAEFNWNIQRVAPFYKTLLNGLFPPQ